MKSIQRYFAIGVLVLLAWTTPAAADWEIELAQQIADEHDCVVAFLSQVIEREVRGHRVLMAKVHCDDERTFDAHRGDDLEMFTFNICEAKNVEAC